MLATTTFLLPFGSLIFAIVLIVIIIGGATTLVWLTRNKPPHAQDATPDNIPGQRYRPDGISQQNDARDLLQNAKIVRVAHILDQPGHKDDLTTPSDILELDLDSGETIEITANGMGLSIKPR